MRTLLVSLLVLVPAFASAQTVRGRVVERGTGTGIAGAALSLGNRRALTFANGEFVIDRAAAGPQTLTVSALGYQPATLALYVIRDTTILIALDVDPIELDTLRVEARYITVRGDVTADSGGIPVAFAEVFLEGGPTEATNAVGRFKLSRVRAEQPATILVRALGYLPLQLDFTPGRDTTVRFSMKVDPVGQRMIDNQIKRLDNRSRTQPHSWRVATQADINRDLGGTLLDFLFIHDFRGSPDCFFIDDVKRGMDRDYLMTFATNEIARIEMIDRRMLRVYTKHYVRRMVRGGVPNLRPIVLSRGLSNACM